MDSATDHLMFLAATAVAGGFAGTLLANASLAFVLWATSNVAPAARRRRACRRNALKIVLKDLREHGHRGLEKFKEFLGKKARAAKKAGELAAARDELARHNGATGNGGM